MTDKFVLWAQALDNASPDHFEVHGKILAPDDTIQRQEAVSLIARVIKTGARIDEKCGVLLTADDSHFVVEVPSAQRDIAGRGAPIVCYGAYESAVGDLLGASAAVALDDFAKRIGRTLLPEHFEIARESFEILKKKITTARLVRTAGVVTVGLMLLVIAYLLTQGG